MPIETHCPKCNALFRLPDELAGRKVKCRNCTTVFAAPTTSTASPTEEEVIQAKLAADEAPAPPRNQAPAGARAAGAAALPETIDDREALPRRSRPERRRDPYREPRPARGGMDPWVLVGIIGGCVLLVGSIVAVVVLPNDAPPPMVMFKPAPPVGFAPPVPVGGGAMAGGPPINFNPNPGPLDVAKAIKLTLANGACDGKYSLDQTDQADPVRRAPCKLFLVELEAGKTYVIDQKSQQFDSFLRLENEQGVQQAQDDDGGGGHDARITFIPKQKGIFRVIATSFNFGLGEFNLSIREMGAANAPIIVPGGAAGGPLPMGGKVGAAPKATITGIRNLSVTSKKEGQASDELPANAEPKQYSFNALTTATYTIHVKAEGFAPVVRLSNRTTGEILQEARAKAGESDLELLFRPVMNGSVRLDISADDKKAGRFTLNIKR